LPSQARISFAAALFSPSAPSAPPLLPPHSTAQAEFNSTGITFPIQRRTLAEIHFEELPSELTVRPKCKRKADFYKKAPHLQNAAAGEGIQVDPPRRHADSCMHPDCEQASQMPEM